MKSINLVYFYNGPSYSFQKYIYDSIFQTIQIHKNINYLLKIFVILPEIEKIKKKFLLNKIETSNIEIYPVKIEELENALKKDYQYAEKIRGGYPHYPRLEGAEPFYNDIIKFRNGFWLYTTTRFFYIEELMRKRGLDTIFHIENDNMIYKDLNQIEVDLKKEFGELSDKICVVQDSANRAIASFMYIPSVLAIGKFNNFILNQTGYYNDMELLSNFKDKNHLPFNIDDLHKYKYLNYIFDGAAIGQFLGGVDPRNCKENTIGFINETCDFKPYPSICDIYFKNENSLKIPYIKSKETNIEQQIVNLHIHCKELHKFSSKTF